MQSVHSELQKSLHPILHYSTVYDYEAAAEKSSKAQKRRTMVSNQPTNA